jgi:hypothetical protein
VQRSILIIGAFATPILFCSGLLVGRQFPAHHYERFGESAYLYDTATARICTITKTDPFAAYGGHALDNPKDAATPSTDALGFQIVGPSNTAPNNQNLIDKAAGVTPSPSPYPVCGE